MMMLQFVTSVGVAPWRSKKRWSSLTAITIAAVAALTACNPQELAKSRGGIRRLSIATGGTGGVYYPYGGAIAKVIGESLPNVEATAEVTAASVDNLKLIQSGKADIAFTLADTLADAVKGQGAFAQGGAVPVRTLAVLYDNYTHLVTTEAHGIQRIADLKGRVVSTGAPGSGTEVIALRVLEAAGLNPDTDVRKQALSAAASVDAIKDSKIDAFFWSGGLPTASVLDLASTPGMTLKLIPNDEVLQTLQAKYGASLYNRIVIPANVYSGMKVDVAVVGVSNALVVSEHMDDELAYGLTKVLFERQAALAATHPEAAKLALDAALVGSPAPFHNGAIRFYKERQVWR